mgnify:CR=1 FL=1
MMKGRSIAVLAILLVALASTTSFEARQTGIVAENGCGCHGGMNSNLSLIHISEPTRP